MISHAPSPSNVLQREIAERLSSFFLGVTDGRSASLDTGAAVATSQGPHRERNEDRCAVVRFRFGSLRPDLRLAILCDGMGGMAKGREAASLALGAFIAAFATIDADCVLARRLEEACRFANASVYGAFSGEAGTTLTAIALGVNAQCVIHVGDSRLYGLDDWRRVDLLTRDDTVAGAVNAHLGQSDEDDLDNRLLQFVGIGEALDPHVTDLSNDSGHSLWLLTSDGAHSVGRKVLAGVCEGSKNPLDLVRKLVFVSEAINTEDNATAVCIKSGHVKSGDDEHEGLTIQITAPNRNLDIWLPPSVVMAGREADEHVRSSEPSPVKPKLPERLPRLARTKKSTVAHRKRQGGRRNRMIDESELPLGVVFEADDSDD